MTKQAIYTAFKTRLPLLQDGAIWEAIEMIEDDGGDLVSRQQAIDFVGAMNMCDQINNDAYKTLTIYLEDLPSAQPQRKKGHWIPVTNGRGGFECNQCHCYAPSYQDGVEWLSAFCPSCGADMRGESK